MLHTLPSASPLGLEAPVTLPTSSPQPHHLAQDQPAWGQDTPTHCSAGDSVLGVSGCHHPRAVPWGHGGLLPLQPKVLSPPCTSRTGHACDLLASTCPRTGGNGCGEGECSGMGYPRVPPHSSLVQPLSIPGMYGPEAIRIHCHPCPPASLLHTGCYHGQKLAGKHPLAWA